MSLHVYEIEDGATTHYAAESMLDAVAMHLKTISEDEIDELCVSMKPDDSNLSIRMTEEPGEPRVTKLCREWAVEAGPLCCSEF